MCHQIRLRTQQILHLVMLQTIVYPRIATEITYRIKLAINGKIAGTSRKVRSTVLKFPA